MQAALQATNNALKATEEKLAEEEMQAVIQLGKVLCRRLKLFGPESDSSAESWIEGVLKALADVREQMQWNSSETKHLVVFNRLDNRLPEILSGIFKVDPGFDPMSGHFHIELP